MPLNNVRFDIDIVAQSSIVHRENYGAEGSDNFSLFRREKIITVDDRPIQVPIVSGSGFRGVLRRIGEQFTAEILDYEGILPIPAAHLLTNGGRLAKSARPMTDEGERRLKQLLPQVAVFGGNASGRVLSGLTIVDKVLPEFAELVHILKRPPHGTPLPYISAMADESFSHLSDHRRAGRSAPHTDSNDKTSPLGQYGMETLPAGTRLQTEVTINNATPSQLAFLRDILDTFALRGHLGGRIAAGHGRVTATVSATVESGEMPGADVDWAADLATHRDEAIQVLSELT
ncbi:RAMP superfamily CRISPR-associated protein [Mycobacterium sp. DBP42]|uniref:RAMP superfamily CRISPR-associated protein n=1 Tax=Mycobacteriaceae TaxID=1762 RepID=UPI00110CB838|nr:RAMP superfamily CRISPR-associated protein [Mycobacterium sp. DBP42]TMS50722.1 hypothetical protein E0T84_22510 [Mycobacterium sp. DBP42]